MLPTCSGVKPRTSPLGETFAGRNEEGALLNDGVAAEIHLPRRRAIQAPLLRCPEDDVAIRLLSDRSQLHIHELVALGRATASQVADLLDFVQRILRIQRALREEEHGDPRGGARLALEALGCVDEPLRDDLLLDLEQVHHEAHCLDLLDAEGGRLDRLGQEGDEYLLPSLARAQAGAVLPVATAQLRKHGPPLHLLGNRGHLHAVGHHEAVLAADEASLGNPAREERRETADRAPRHLPRRHAGDAVHDAGLPGLRAIHGHLLGFSALLGLLQLLRQHLLPLRRRFSLLRRRLLRQVRFRHGVRWSPGSAPGRHGLSHVSGVAQAAPERLGRAEPRGVS
eukprot:scaffold1277_cov253-Pinguiococcus_pyrenoidosus.AAC.46